MVYWVNTNKHQMYKSSCRLSLEPKLKQCTAGLRPRTCDLVASLVLWCSLSLCESISLTNSILLYGTPCALSLVGKAESTTPGDKD